MIKRLVALLFSLFFVCIISWANEEHSIILEKGNNSRTIELPYGNISFTLVENANNQKVLIAIENTTNSQALLIFRNSRDEKELKKNKPKIEFEKTFPGSKGNRRVYGCKELNSKLLIVEPQEKSDICEIEGDIPSSIKMELPIYSAKYNPKLLTKKGAYNINYKILSEDVLSFTIEIKGWNEDDPEYVEVKSVVDEYLYSLKSAAFCKNKKHSPSLSKQQEPYQEKKDSLINVIESMLRNHKEWLPSDAPHKAYMALMNQLEQVDLNDYNYDCGNHKKATKQHSCSYCSLSAQEIYHQLDDLYQQLRAGKVNKEEAVTKAKALYNCYQNSTKRKKDSFYSSKISGFYNRIIK